MKKIHKMLSENKKKEFAKNSTLSKKEFEDSILYVKTGVIFLKSLNREGKEIITSIVPDNSFIYIDQDVNEQDFIFIKEHAVIYYVETASILSTKDSFLIEEVFIFLKNEKLRREFFIKDCLSSTNKDGLYHILIRLSKTFGSHQNKGILINLNITHEELSQFSGYSRSHISKILKKLSNKNIIEFENRKIVIKNLNWLENQINCEKCEINICST